MTHMSHHRPLRMSVSTGNYSAAGARLIDESDEEEAPARGGRRRR